MAPTKVSPIWKHFKIINKNEIRCSICGILYKNNFNSAKAHLIIKHRMCDEEDYLKWENDNSSVWRYFSRGKAFEVRCNLCGKSLKNAFFKSRIEKHIICVHDEDVVAPIRENMSQHFLFTKCYATCKLEGCGYTVKILEGIGTLKTHLNDHKTNVFLEREEGTRDNNENRMIPQSVGNYLGTSSYRDNTYWPPLGYPEGYWMIQHYVGNYAGPSSYHNNSHLHSLGNQGGQQSGQQGSRSPVKFWRPW